MGSLRDALLKAGLKSSQPTKNFKKVKKNTRPHNRKIEAKKHQKVHDHQQHKNFCESCRKISPDVEFYQHDNKQLKANWMCCICADKHRIPDECRITKQSDFSRKSMFRREYGATKRF